MRTVTQTATNLAALVLAVIVVGCATAATITGHLSSGDLLAVFAGTGGIGGLVTTAHVVGTQVNNAAGTPPTPPAPPSGVV